VDDFIIVFVLAPNLEESERIAMMLINSGSAPCINIVQSCLSIYQWKGEVHRDEEVLMIIKSIRDRFHDICEIVERSHPYDVPEIISIPLGEISTKYSSFLKGFLA